MNKYFVNLVKLLRRYVKGISLYGLLKFKYRMINADNDIARNLARDSDMLAKDINTVLEKVKGKHERQQKK